MNRFHSIGKATYGWFDFVGSSIYSRPDRSRQGEGKSINLLAISGALVIDFFSSGLSRPSTNPFTFHTEKFAIDSLNSCQG